jgi:hypothetical protein
VTFRLSHCPGVVAEKLNAFAVDETQMMVNALSRPERIVRYFYKESECCDVINAPFKGVR